MQQHRWFSLQKSRSRLGQYRNAFVHRYGTIKRQLIAALPELRAKDAPVDRRQFSQAIAQLNVKRIQSIDAPGVLSADSLLIGCAPPVAAGPLDPKALAIDNKPSGFKTATEMAIAASDDFFAEWPLWAQRPMEPKDVLDSVTLVVEDASPDSVWALVVLLARLANHDMKDVLDRWLPSIIRWEETGLVDEPFKEWPGLASALGHFSFRRGAASANQDYAEGWTNVLRFAGDCLLRDAGPVGLPDAADWTLLQQARAIMRQEEQTYRNWLQHALSTQLSLPLRGGAQRRLLVDGLIFVEDELTGAAKIFYRNDTAQSPLGYGFTFAASYRPDAPKGSGGEFTITVDERRRVDLVELWEELERREDLAWSAAGETRPSWKPRMQRLGPYNQPWWLSDNHTLIAAPRSVAESAEKDAKIFPGTKLNWSDVRAAIWSVCNPLINVFVIDHAGKVVRLLDLRREPAKPGWKNILTARWPSPSDPLPMPPVRSLGSAPVVERVLAALIAHGARKEALDIGELPQQDSWRRVGLPGGFALITAAGVFVLDDWREIAKLDLAAIEDTCRLACQIDHDLNQLEQNEIAPLAREIGVLLSSNRLNQERVDLVVRAARLSVRLSELRARTSLAPPDVDARLIRDALDDAWALSRRLTAMNQQAEAINASLKALGDGIVRRITIFVAIWGFPFYVASGLAMPLSKLLVSICRANGWLAGSLPAVGQDPSPILWWSSFIVLSFAGWALVQRLRVRDPLLPNASVK